MYRFFENIRNPVSYFRMRQRSTEIWICRKAGEQLQNSTWLFLPYTGSMG